MGDVAVGLAIALPVGIFLISLLALYTRSDHDLAQWMSVPALAVMVSAAALTPSPVLVIGLLLTAFVAIKVATHANAAEPG